MTLDIVRDAWMRISTINKRDNPVSPNYGRIRAGRKGIGRFAVQRLGKSLILETEIKGSNEGLRVTFHWDKSFTDGKSLADIFSNVETYPKDPTTQLTRLTIIGLREAWTPAALQRAWKAILLLQPPFKLKNKFLRNEDIPKDIDPGFEVIINGVTRRQQTTELSIDNAFLEHAIAEINGSIDEQGNAKIRVTSNKLELDDSQELEQKLMLTGPISFETKYFIYAAETLSGFNKNTALEMASKYGGIRIYRNGFRVLPYGERSDDWLSLDHDYGRRVLLVPANNQNFFGHVEIDAELNPLFEETSSREGIIENEAFDELQKFVRTAVEWGVKRVAEARERKITAGQKDFVSKKTIRKPTEILDSLRAEINSSSSNTSTDDNKAITTTLLEAAQAEVEAWEEHIELQQAESLKYEEMLRILASLGLSITVFSHEIKGVRSSVSANITNLSSITEGLEDGEDRRSLTEGINWIETATNRMFDLGGYIAGLMSSTESRELRTLSIKGVIERFIEQFQKYIERQHIKFVTEIPQQNLQTIAMHSSEIDSILLNLMTNSIKSIKKSKNTPRKIRIQSFEDDGDVVILFEDNGTGVPDDIAHRIFDPFFTTTVGIEDDTVAGPGTGLGLKIISDIAQSYGGGVRLIPPDENYNCCFEVRIKALKKQGAFNEF
ncbi:Histidine kinase [Pseudomonas chlororaphis]|uniref:sensor histidine kinase n=1 Tax=Pseudomonas chlororaphis TaxID=587753 RepID=UPI0039E1EB9B